MKKLPAKKSKTAKKKTSANHNCHWREAAIKLARCVVATLQADGKIGMGSGMVMSVKDGKKIIERWDKDFQEALAFIGIEVVDKPPKTTKTPKASMRQRRQPVAAETPAP
ncbi:MAG TPA: hypothetical protein VLE97_09015 [Gaiellaceae bacterium]|nr:hypothetical protein [Gaiellaceae bacterium]